MFGTDSHTMELLSVDDTGTEEWYCRVCGRHFLMRWPPRYSKTVLVPGDIEATHIGGKGGLHMGGVEVAQSDPLIGLGSDSPLHTMAEPIDEVPLMSELLDPWKKLIDSLDEEI